MSGGGGGTPIRPSKPSGPGGGEENGGVDCTKIKFNTNLKSPNPDVIQNLEEGDVLAVQVDNGGPLIAVHATGTAGSITHYRFSDIKKCIIDGYTFLAEVTEISGGNCEVSVYSFNQ